jgi:acyl-CoA synthetase (AMP-forming)/AMP-acid ligase II
MNHIPGKSPSVADTVFGQFQQAALDEPTLPFLCYPASHARGYCEEGAEFSYVTSMRIVEGLSTQYRAAGFTRGHRVALMVGNRPEHFWHLLALNSIGACVVTLNQDYLPHELAYGIGFADSSLVLTATPWLDKVQEAVRSLGRSIPVIDVCAPPPAFPTPAFHAEEVPARDGDLPALIIYTSGTTGRPKGCVISNTSCLAAAESYTSAGGLIEFHRGSDRLYVPLPAFHMNISVYALNSIIRLRNCLIVQDRFSASRWLSDLIETRATCFHYLGIIPPILVKMPPSSDDRRHSARFGSGAGVDPPIREAFEERFGVPLVEAWGMTETSRAIQNSEVPRNLVPRAFGRPRPPLEVRVVDDHDEDVPTDTPGELLVRAAGGDPRFGFFSGYLKQSEETERAWRGGWFHTGDVVRQRADGLLIFVERRKNIIRRSGENIAAAEVEEALQTFDHVAGVAVLAVADELHDEEIMACIVLRAGIPVTRSTAAALLAALPGRLGATKVPAWIAFVNELPVTGTLKVQKGVIFPQGVDPRMDPRSIDLREEKRELRRLETSGGHA